MSSSVNHGHLQLPLAHEQFLIIGKFHLILFIGNTIVLKIIAPTQLFTYIRTPSLTLKVFK